MIEQRVDRVDLGVGERLAGGHLVGGGREPGAVPVGRDRPVVGQVGRGGLPAERADDHRRQTISAVLAVDPVDAGRAFGALVAGVALLALLAGRALYQADVRPAGPEEREQVPLVRVGVGRLRVDQRLAEADLDRGGREPGPVEIGGDQPGGGQVGGGGLPAEVTDDRGRGPIDAVDAVDPVRRRGRRRRRPRAGRSGQEGRRSRSVPAPPAGPAGRSALADRSGLPGRERCLRALGRRCAAAGLPPPGGPGRPVGPGPPLIPFVPGGPGGPGLALRPGGPGRAGRARRALAAPTGPCAGGTRPLEPVEAVLVVDQLHPIMRMGSGWLRAGQRVGPAADRDVRGAVGRAGRRWRS